MFKVEDKSFISQCYTKKMYSLGMHCPIPTKKIIHFVLNRPLVFTRLLCYSHYIFCIYILYVYIFFLIISKKK